MTGERFETDDELIAARICLECGNDLYGCEEEICDACAFDEEDEEVEVGG